MKLAVGLFFLFITFLGVVSQASSTCGDNHSSRQSHSTISSSQEQHQSFQHEDLNQDRKKDSGCHHSGSTCRNCHLGHCAFTLGTSINFATSIPPQILTFTKVSVIIFDFQKSPFRPPIA